jgi:hypothetical protein
MVIGFIIPRTSNKENTLMDDYSQLLISKLTGRNVAELFLNFLTEEDQVAKKAGLFSLSIFCCEQKYPSIGDEHCD